MFTVPAARIALRAPATPSDRYRAGLRRLATALAMLALVPAPEAGAADQAASPLRIAVASNFRGAIEDLAGRYTARTGVSVTISSAASGVLAAQILRGAPFDVFFAADRDRAQVIVNARRAAGSAVCYARGRLVLLGADDLGAALADRERSIAIANPRSAPYGAAAAAVLQRAGFAGPDQRRVLRGGNVQQALQFFDSGAAQLALVARSLAGDRGIAVPAAWHPPIDQYAVVIDRGAANAVAEEFLRTLDSDEARRALASRGYEPCP
jgi:molybdate transport system substrate-binding protein